MKSILDDVRTSLLEEARRSPELLSDLAGLEQYIAESYDSRSFAELLQNADDAGASKFLVQRSGAHLLVANDGRVFTHADFESLCRSAASNKERGASIGYRGIGFKSVVGLARTVYLFSGDLAATFSRERTAREIPQAKRVPLIRIPQPVSDAERASFAVTLTKILDEGFKSVFVFEDLIASGIESEFAAFDPTALLFLRNVRQLELRTHVEEIITVRREAIDKTTRKIRLATSNAVGLWTIISRADVALAFAQDEAGIRRLEEQTAVAHAFLPTHEPTGLGIKINGDFSTDPSRTRVILDERTKACIDQVAKLVVELLMDNLNSTDPVSPSGTSLDALIPTSDPRTFAFQRRTFKTELLAAIKQVAHSRIEIMRCRPTWLNASDFDHIASASGLKVIPRHFEEIDGLVGFLRYLGATDATLDELSSGIANTSLSISGCAEIVAHLVNLYSIKQISSSYIRRDWKLWPVLNSTVSLDEAVQMTKPLNQRFVDMVVEHIAGRPELRRFIEELTNPNIAHALLSDSSIGTTSVHTHPRDDLNEQETPLSFSKSSITLKRWRNAEQQVLALLTEQGWQASDVSRGNVGYDIEGRTPNEQASFIEVKSIDYPGQAFTLTSNEEAVAREKGDAFYIALVCQKKDTLEIMFIRNPATRLKFIRQCRQWVWECSEYDYQPRAFAVQ